MVGVISLVSVFRQSFENCTNVLVLSIRRLLRMEIIIGQRISHMNKPNAEKQTINTGTGSDTSESVSVALCDYVCNPRFQPRDRLHNTAKFQNSVPVRQAEIESPYS